MNNIISLPDEIILEIHDILSRINQSRLELSESAISVSKFEKELEYLKQKRDLVMQKCIDLDEERSRVVMRIVDSYGEGELDLQSGKYFLK